MKIASILIMMLIVVNLTGCDAFKTESQLRELRAQEATGNIVIGVAWPLESLSSKFREGVELACKTVNDDGGINGREIEMRFVDDGSSVTKGLTVAQEFVNDLDVVAVIGHYNSYISLPASTVYNNGGIIMFTPSSTAPELTERNIPLLFRNIPTDHEFGRQLAGFAQKKGFQKVMIYYINNSYGRGLANAFEDRAGELELSIIDRLSYDGGSYHEFLQALEKWKYDEYDAIFLAGTIPEAAHFIKTIRDRGVTVPVFGGDGLDNYGLIDEAGKSAEGVMVASVYNLDNDSPENRKFLASFRSEYDDDPDMWAAQGYDALMILAEGIKSAGTSAPRKVADALKNIETLDRVTGNYHFNDEGDIEGIKLFIKIVKDGKFTYMMDL